MSLSSYGFAMLLVHVILCAMTTLVFSLLFMQHNCMTSDVQIHTPGCAPSLRALFILLWTVDVL